MSDSNPSAATAAGLRKSPEIQQLIGLLGNLMPLLLRFQTPGLEQPFLAGAGSFPVPDPALDQQAAVNLVSDITSDSLRNLSAYLETNASRHPALADCVPIVTQATQNFAARDYAQAFNLIWHAYRWIAKIRGSDPQVPPLRSAASTAASSLSAQSASSAARRARRTATSPRRQAA